VFYSVYGVTLIYFYSYYYTPIMLAIACLVISAKQYGGSPIECWVNPHSRESMEEYIESFCW